jgi:hypothetical protein
MLFCVQILYVQLLNLVKLSTITMNDILTNQHQRYFELRSWDLELEGGATVTA